jgi:hypothetical protein
MSRRRLGARAVRQLNRQLSDRDRAILKSVSNLKLLSARQVEALHFAVGENGATALTRARSCRRVLERMARDRLLYRLERRIGGIRAGSASFIYGLGPAGQRLLDPTAPRRRATEPSASHVTHTLAVADAFTSIAEAGRQGLWEVLVVQTEPHCWRKFLGFGGGVSMLRPDLFVAVAVGRTEYRCFLEVDLATQHLSALNRKVSQYLAYFRSGSEQSAYQVFPKVLWLVEDEERAKQLGRVIRQANREAELFGLCTTQQFPAVLTGGRWDETAKSNRKEVR